MTFNECHPDRQNTVSNAQQFIFNHDTSLSAISTSNDTLLTFVYAIAHHSFSKQLVKNAVVYMCVILDMLMKLKGLIL